MDPEHWKLVGVLTKTQGKDGELLLKLKKGFPSDFHPEDPVFIPIERENEALPFYFDQLQRISKKQYVVRFDLIDSEASASRFVGYGVWLPHSSYPEAEREGSLLEKVTGYRVMDREQGDLGIIEDGIDRPEQPLAYAGGQRTPVPLTDAFIERIDEERKILYTRLPEGLSEL